MGVPVSTPPVDLSKYAPLANPTFTGTITAGYKMSMGSSGTTGNPSSFSIYGQNPTINLVGDSNSYYPQISFAGVSGSSGGVTFGYISGYAPATLLYNCNTHGFRTYAGVVQAIINSTGMSVTGIVTTTGNMTVGQGTKYPITLSTVSATSSIGIGGTSGLNTASTGTYNIAIGPSSGAALTSGGSNTFVGLSAGQAVTTGGSNTLIGTQAGYSITTGGSNTIVGAYQGSTALSSAVVLADGAGAIALQRDGSGNYTFPGAGSATFSCASMLAPNLSTTASAANAYLDANGSLLKSTSSGLYKTDIETMGETYADAVMAVRPIWYRSLAAADNPDWSWYGFSAEEVAAIDPRLAHYAYQPDQYETYEVSPAQPAVDGVPATYDDDGNVITPEVIPSPAIPATTGRRVKAGEAVRPDGVQYDRFTAVHHSVIQRQSAAISSLEERISKLEQALAAAIAVSPNSQAAQAASAILTRHVK